MLPTLKKKKEYLLLLWKRQAIFRQPVSVPVPVPLYQPSPSYAAPFLCCPLPLRLALFVHLLSYCNNCIVCASGSESARAVALFYATYIHSASSRSRIQQRSLEFVFGASVPSLTCAHPRGGCSLLIRLSLTRSFCVSLYSIYSRALFVPASLAARLWVRVVYLFLRLWAAYCVGKSGALIFRTCTCMQTYRDMLVHV